MIGKPDVEGQYHPITQEKASELESVLIEDDMFSVRSFNVFRNAGIKNALELALLSEEDIAGLKNCGVKSLKEMKSFLYQLGIEELPVCIFEAKEEQKEYAASLKSKDDKAQSLADNLELLKTINVMDIYLSVRSRNCLTKNEIKNLHDFAILTYDQALRIQGLGRNSIKELTKVLKGYGVTFPLKNFDPSDLHPSLQYIGLSDETLTILNDGGITLLDDLANLTEEQLYDLLNICPEVDSLRIIFSLTTVKEITLRNDYFDQYLKFCIDEIAKNLNKSEVQVLSLAYGLNGQRRWPRNILSSSLALKEEELDNLLVKILSIYLLKTNTSRIKPLIDYYKNNNDINLQSGYMTLLKQIVAFNEGETL